MTQDLFLFVKIEDTKVIIRKIIDKIKITIKLTLT